MIYKISLKNNFNQEDISRAVETTKKNHKGEVGKIQIHDDKDDINLVFNSKLPVVLTFLEYLLESNITLDQENFIVQNGKKTNAKLDITISY